MKKRKASEAAPVQVYLAMAERSRLDRLAAQFATTKSEIIRRGLAALEREALDPARHPALAVIGLASAERSTDALDAARDHDRLLTDGEVDSWTERTSEKPVANPSAPRRGR